MKLTDAQREKLQSHLRQKATVGCQVCGGKSWTFHNEVVEMRPFEGGNFVVGGKLIPLVLVSCNQCQQLIFFSAGALGLVGETK